MWFDSIDLDRYRNLHRRISGNLINVNPIQTGGVIPLEARKALQEFLDGYSVCDFCSVPGGGRLDSIKDPPISNFMIDLAKFVDMDEVRVVHGAREGIFAVMHSIARPGETVVVDSLAHYTTYVAAENAGLNVVEVPHSGPPFFRLTSEGFAEKVEEVRQTTGRNPSLIVLSHVDYEYGNLADAGGIGRTARKYGIPFLLNCAYTVGRMPVSGRQLQADFLVASAHKSMATCGPAGLLAATSDFAKRTFRRSTNTGTWSGKKLGKKDVEFLGCTLRGLPVVSMMASFPHVVERVRKWEDEVNKARWFASQLERIEGIKQLGDKPHNHDITFYDSPPLAKIAEKHKRKGFFLYDELKEKGIMGLEPGLSKSFHLSTYMLTWDQVRSVADAFRFVAEKYSMPHERENIKSQLLSN
ncbi:MAG: O-phospho-L-seryl-tRNA:Cys-tRNA synthase [Promethearchaeati archaeon SRVP18_Atabeyarchaeia-1]